MNYHLNFAKKSLDLSQIAVMGVLNITPDSFSDGGRFMGLDKARKQARKMLDEGANIIDIGGESTRPGAHEVSIDEELERVIPVIEMLNKEFDCIISIDTSKPQVMFEAVNAGAGLVNDVYALQADTAIEVVAKAGIPVCLMHMRGSPKNMQSSPTYDDVVAEVKLFLTSRVQACEEAGITRDNIIIDPGFGFGKSTAHNVELLNNLTQFCEMGIPVLVGLSRKSMIGHLLGLSIEEREVPSVALALFAVQQGARIVRVHDVKSTVNAIRMIEALKYLE